MALTFSIGGTAFGSLSSAAAGRYAKEFAKSSEEYARSRYHVPGVDGNFVSRGGRVTQTVLASVRYVGTIAQIYGYYDTDAAAWDDTAVAIIDPNSTSTTGWNLESMQPIANMGRIIWPVNGTLSYMDVALTFRRDS